jgi:hypothetical protein
MTLTIEIPETVVKRAASLGVSVDTLVSQAVSDIGREPAPQGFRYLGPATMTPAEAGARMRELRKNYTLGGISPKELIEEGRR